MSEFTEYVCNNCETEIWIDAWATEAEQNETLREQGWNTEALTCPDCQ